MPVVHTPSRQSVATRRQGTASLGCLRLFFGLFFLAGVAAFYGLTIRPLWLVLMATRWVETPCVIDSSRVGVHRGSRARDRPAYTVDLVYHYEFRGIPFTSRRYQFTGASSSGRKDKEQVVSQYPVGRNAICYVNPSAPAEAVIDRRANLTMAAGAFSLLFVAVGGFGLWFAPRLAGPQQMASMNAMPVVAPASGEWVEIKPQVTPLGKFLGLLAFGIVWNGFISIFVYFIFFSPSHAGTPLFAKIFVGLFVLIGVLIILAAIGGFIALFNPRIVLATRTPAIPLGGQFRFQWKIKGRVEKLKKLSIRLEGSEQATYHSGDNLQTTTHLFADVPVLELLDRDILPEGELGVVIPAGLMHTFTGRHNRIIWRLHVRGEIPLLAPVDEDFPFTVLPAPPSV